MIEAYKILSGIYDTRVTQGLLSLHREQTQLPDRNGGHTKKLFKRRAHLNVRQKFFSNRVVEVWNNLPQEVIDAPSVKSFERWLDKYWQNQDNRL